VKASRTPAMLFQPDSTAVHHVAAQRLASSARAHGLEVASRVRGIRVRACAGSHQKACRKHTVVCRCTVKRSWTQKVIKDFSRERVVI
jgi:DTW domain-containing protein YfiP